MTGEQPARSVLIIDESRETLQALVAVLKRGGLAPRPVRTSRRAIEAAAAEPPDAVLLNLNMPDLNGFDVCRWFKRDERFRNAPVLFMAGGSDPEARVEAFRAGAVDCIDKPIREQDVLARVRTHLRLAELRVDLELHNAQLRSEGKKLHDRLVAVSQAARDAIIMIEHDGSIVFWNEAAESMFGYSRNEALGKNLHALIAPDRLRGDHKAAFNRFQAGGLTSGRGSTTELVGLKKSGEEFPVELSLAATEVEDRWCAVGIVRDISARKKDEAALRESEVRYRASFEGASVGQALMDLDGRFLKVNRAMSSLLGYEPAELIGRRFVEFTQAEDAEKSLAARQALLRGDGPSHRMDKRYRRKDGATVWADVSIAVLRDPAGSATHFITHVIDISTRKRAEEKLRAETEARQKLEMDLRHSQKLEAVGQLAAGIAHEINTPIQFVGDSVRFLKEAFDAQRALIGHYRRAVEALAHAGVNGALVDQICSSESELDLDYLERNVPGSIDRCLGGVSRVATIVRAMKEFAHPDGGEKSPADLNAALSATLAIARNEYKYVADVETDWGEIPAVACYVGDLNQVFLNLIVNAAHAIAEVVGNTGSKGKIRVSTRRDGPWVNILVADSGCGIPESIRDRVFEPFFTTKPVGKGSGQGLAIARSIVVEKHGGELNFESTIGKGTTFTIRLAIDGKPCPPDSG